MKFRPWHLAVVFWGALGLLSLGAYETALGINGSWYDASTSILVFQTAMAVSTLLLLGLLTIVAMRSPHEPEPRFEATKALHPVADTSPDPVLGKVEDLLADPARGDGREALAAAAAHHARRQLVKAMAGPVLMCLGFLAIAAAMLPAAPGWLQQHYKLNNALVWILSYGWPILASYAALSVLLFSSPRHR